MAGPLPLDRHRALVAHDHLIGSVQEVAVEQRFGKALVVVGREHLVTEPVESLASIPSDPTAGEPRVAVTAVDAEDMVVVPADRGRGDRVDAYKAEAPRYFAIARARLEHSTSGRAWPLPSFRYESRYQARAVPGGSARPDERGKSWTPVIRRARRERAQTGRAAG